MTSNQVFDLVRKGSEQGGEQKSEQISDGLNLVSLSGTMGRPGTPEMMPVNKDTTSGFLPSVELMDGNGNEVEKVARVFCPKNFGKNFGHLTVMPRPYDDVLKIGLDVQSCNADVRFADGIQGVRQQALRHIQETGRPITQLKLFGHGGAMMMNLGKQQLFLPDKNEMQNVTNHLRGLITPGGVLEFDACDLGPFSGQRQHVQRMVMDNLSRMARDLGVNVRIPLEKSTDAYTYPIDGPIMQFHPDGTYRIIVMAPTT
jgi:hypothetical protein